MSNVMNKNLADSIPYDLVDAKKRRAGKLLFELLFELLFSLFTWTLQAYATYLGITFVVAGDCPFNTLFIHTPSVMTAAPF